MARGCWEIADRDHPERPGPRYVDLADVARVMAKVDSPRFYVRWVAMGR